MAKLKCILVSHTNRALKLSRKINLKHTRTSCKRHFTYKTMFRFFCKTALYDVTEATHKNQQMNDAITLSIKFNALDSTPSTIRNAQSTRTKQQNHGMNNGSREEPLGRMRHVTSAAAWRKSGTQPCWCTSRSADNIRKKVTMRCSQKVAERKTTSQNAYFTLTKTLLRVHFATQHSTRGHTRKIKLLLMSVDRIIYKKLWVGLTVSSCVVQIVCVIKNQGSSNPNCFSLTARTVSFSVCFTFA